MSARRELERGNFALDPLTPRCRLDRTLESAIEFGDADDLFGARHGRGYSAVLPTWYPLPPPMPTWLFALSCVVLPAAWGVLMYFVFGAFERRYRRVARKDAPPPIDYSI